jgi:hypothetical protein
VQKTTKLKITTTRKRTINISISRGRAFCADCNGEVQTLTSREAAEFLGTREQEIEDLIAVGKVHKIRTVSGSFRVCKDSLSGI